MQPQDSTSHHNSLPQVEFGIHTCLPDRIRTLGGLRLRICLLVYLRLVVVDLPEVVAALLAARLVVVDPREVAVALRVVAVVTLLALGGPPEVAQDLREMAEVMVDLRELMVDLREVAVALLEEVVGLREVEDPQVVDPQTLLAEGAPQIRLVISIHSHQCLRTIHTELHNSLHK